MTEEGINPQDVEIFRGTRELEIRNCMAAHRLLWVGSIKVYTELSEVIWTSLLSVEFFFSGNKINERIFLKLDHTSLPDHLSAISEATRSDISDLQQSLRELNS